MVAGVIMTVIWAIIVILTNLSFRNRSETYMAARRDVFQSAFESVLETYGDFSRFIFETEINRGDVQEIMADVAHADESQKSRLRERLHALLSDIYSQISRYSFRQLHFHLPTGESFLRFHSPDDYGDFLFDIRDTVRICNQEKRMVYGFEEGRVLNGYRMVYPLSYNGVHVGSVEVSLSMTRVVPVLLDTFRKHDIALLVRRDIMESVVFQDKQDQYRSTIVSDDYVADVEVLQALDASANKLGLGADADFMRKVREGAASHWKEDASFSFSIRHAGEHYLVHFLQIRSVVDKPVGYLYAIGLDTQIKGFDLTRLEGLLLSILIYGLMWALLLLFTRNRRIMMEMALHDQLTGTLNRHAFMDELVRDTHRADRTGSPMSLAMIDIDHFKRINDRYGHSVGDRTLKTLVDLMRTNLRASDVLARYGGEEFVLLMPDTTEQQAYEAIERLREHIGTSRFPDFEESISVSAGVAEREPDEPPGKWIDRADAALYAGKEGGRNKTIKAQ